MTADTPRCFSRMATTLVACSGMRIAGQKFQTLGTNSHLTHPTRQKEDLHKLVTHLKLHNFALVGFSMGGGEVARYIGKHGPKGVTKAVIIGGIPPYLLK